MSSAALFRNCLVEAYLLGSSVGTTNVMIAIIFSWESGLAIWMWATKYCQDVKIFRVAATFVTFVTFQIVFLSKTFLIVPTIKIRALMGLDVRSSDMFPRNLSRIFDRLTLTVTYLSRYWREKVFWHVRQVKVDSSPKEAMERASVARVFSGGLSSTSDRTGGVKIRNLCANRDSQALV
jgi:hypothetical protein